MASIHTLTTGAGERRYAVRYRENGRQRSRTFLRKRDADAFRADTIRRRQLGELYEDDGGTLGEFVDGWLDRYALRVRPSSYRRRRDALRVLDSLRGRPLARLTPADVEDAVTGVAARAPRQAELALASVKLALKDAGRRGVRFDRRILDIPGPRSRPRAPSFLTWKQVQDLAQWLPDRHARLVMVAALTGLRRGEIMGLTWGDVNLEQRTLRVAGGKTDAARRVVDLSATAVELLREQGEAGVSRAAGLPVFTNNRGGHLNAANWYRRWFLPVVRTLAEGGNQGRADRRTAPEPVDPAPPSASVYRGVTFHSLRHSFISMMAAAGAHPSVIAQQVGHADGGALVLRRYRHLFPQEGRAAADRLDAYLQRTPGEQDVASADAGEDGR
jgi:integrase